MSRLLAAEHQAYEDKEPPLGKNQPPSKPTRLEEARQIIEEYAADLREIIKKLRRSLN
jgi:hypothetical protein